MTPIRMLLARHTATAHPVDGTAQGGVGVEAGAQGGEGERLDQIVQRTEAHRRSYGGHIAGRGDHEKMAKLVRRAIPDHADSLKALEELQRRCNEMIAAI